MKRTLKLHRTMHVTLAGVKSRLWLYEFFLNQRTKRYVFVPLIFLSLMLFIVSVGLVIFFTLQRKNIIKERIPDVPVNEPHPATPSPTVTTPPPTTAPNPVVTPQSSGSDGIKRSTVALIVALLSLFFLVIISLLLMYLRRMKNKDSDDLSLLEKDSINLLRKMIRGLGEKIVLLQDELKSAKKDKELSEKTKQQLIDDYAREVTEMKKNYEVLKSQMDSVEDTKNKIVAASDLERGLNGQLIVAKDNELKELREKFTRIEMLNKINSQVIEAIKQQHEFAKTLITKFKLKFKDDSFVGKEVERLEQLNKGLEDIVTVFDLKAENTPDVDGLSKSLEKLTLSSSHENGRRAP